MHSYFPNFPQITKTFALPLFRDTVSLSFWFSPPWTGFFYFVNLDITASIWIFYILTTIQRGIFNIVGLQSTQRIDFYSIEPFLAHQGMGSMIVFVLVGLWVGRGHLQNVYRKAFHGDEAIDDSGEMLSYRQALLGLLAALALVVVGLCMMGLTLPTSALFRGAGPHLRSSGYGTAHRRRATRPQTGRLAVHGHWWGGDGPTDVGATSVCLVAAQSSRLYHQCQLEDWTYLWQCLSRLVPQTVNSALRRSQAVPEFAAIFSRPDLGRDRGGGRMASAGLYNRTHGELSHADLTARHNSASAPAPQSPLGPINRAGIRLVWPHWAASTRPAIDAIARRTGR